MELARSKTGTKNFLAGYLSSDSAMLETTSFVLTTAL